jgi:phosphoglycolate phosphatase-like HAD superfamily hydrolase
MNYTLIIFDIDGTIATRESGALLSGVADFFNLLPRARNRPAIAFATNQGGPACRDAGWGEKYPTLTEVERKYAALANSMGARLYMSLIYQGNDGYIVPRGLSTTDPRLNPQWRKPAPGMLIQAMRDAGASPAATLMVGDRPEDAQAAAAAGCYFQWSQKFFARGWEKGKNYGLFS